MLNNIPFELTFRKYNLTCREYQMTMRYLLLILFIVTLWGCRSQEQQPVPAFVATPLLLANSTSTLVASPAPIMATQIDPTPKTTKELPSPTLTAPQTGKPLLKETRPSQSGYPVEPTPVVVANAYPDSNPELGTEPIWGYRIVNEYPHDTSAYTQGLVIENDLRTLLEGTGREASLRRVDLQSGEIKQYSPLPEGLFGEGITLYKDRIVQLTWHSQVGFIYDDETFDPVGVFYYPHQGWGITHDGSLLIVSDGTDTIRFWDPDTFQEVRRIQVTHENGPLTMINELEFVEGEIWANVWHTDLIARISPEDGRVLGWIDLAGLLGPHLPNGPEAVLNGIAYDAGSRRLFVTGKLWPSLFEIEVVKPDRN